MDSKLLKLLTHYNLDAYYGKLVILGIDTLEGFSTISDESILSLGIERDSNDFIQIKKLSDLVRSTLEKMEKQKKEIQSNNTKAGKTSILKSMRVFFVVVALMIAVSVGITLFQNGNQRNEKLRTNDIHFRILVGHIDDSGVIEFIIRFKHRNKDCILAFLLVSILIEFFEEILVFMLRFRGLHLVFHFEHDGQVFNVILGFPENEVAFAA